MHGSTSADDFHIRNEVVGPPAQTTISLEHVADAGLTSA